MTKDYYKILEITEQVSEEDIKIAYRRLARKWHPDIAGNTKEVISMFKDINEAYEVLSNKVKKNEYDKARRFYNYAHEKTSTNDTTATKKNTTKPQDLKKNFSFNWEEFLGKKYRESAFKKEEAKAPKKGDDIYTDIEISYFEAISGVTKTINMLQTQVCPKCRGRKFANDSICTCCNGKGELTNHKKFNVKIPAGIKNYSKIRLAGEGNKGINNGANGDLYIVIHVVEQNFYKMEGLNILKTIPIAPYEAVLGTIIKISTPNGNVDVKIAPKTQNGQKIRLTGCGIVQNNHVGDMIITVEIKIPKNLSNEEINLYKKLEEISSCNIRHLEDA
jgi:DnaJ-class molecular chaperone